MLLLRQIGLSLAILGSALASAGAVRAQQDDPVVPVEHRVDIGGGRSSNLVCLGEGEPTVVLEDGFGGMVMGWRKVQVPVSAFTRICAYDRAGIGYSDPSPKAMTAKAITDDLHRLVRRGGIARPFVLVGHSIGGLYATLYADRFLSDLAGLVLIEPSFAHQGEEMGLAYAAAAAQSSHEMDNRFQTCAALARQQKLAEGDATGCIVIETDVPAYHDYMLHMGLSPAYWDALASENRSFGLGVDEIDTRQEDRARRSFGDLPVIVLTAGGQGEPKTDDPSFTGWKAGHDRLAARSSRGESIVVPNAGHAIQRDQPQPVIDAIRKIVDEARVSGTR